MCVCVCVFVCECTSACIWLPICMCSFCMERETSVLVIPRCWFWCSYLSQELSHQLGDPLHSHKVSLQTYNIISLLTGLTWPCTYSFRAERQAASSGYSGRVNKLVSPYSAGEEDGAELTAAVQEQCQQANGFILAVNAARLEQEGEFRLFNFNNNYYVHRAC